MSKENRPQGSPQHGRPGGMPRRPDDEALTRRTEQERVDAGLDAYDPDDVPAATDTPTRAGVTDSDVYREEKAEIDREVRNGEMTPDQLQAPEDRDPYPPTRHDER
ncbi:DEAD/DEAH box helicase [Streptomyces sp. DT24]|uniref:DEAD/DEAH box helicase n=1 Tax=Streptomyces sp. DT24 TaxID=3416520 RepID=UPI003CF2C243